MALGKGESNAVDALKAKGSGHGVGAGAGLGGIARPLHS
jgi:hypothetical protein